MNQIISNQYFDLSKTFIQENIQREYLTKENVDKLISLYNSLTVENSKWVYDTANELCLNDRRIFEATINNIYEDKWFYYSKLVFFAGSCIYALCYLGIKKSNKNSNLYHICEMVVPQAGIITFFGVVAYVAGVYTKLTNRY